MSAGIGAADAAIYTGVCLDNNDPLKLGRIRFCVPQLSGTTSFGWALPAYPGTTALGATVYIAFEGGDRNRPIFWPDQVPTPPPISYPTFAALSAANPTSTTPVGTTFYVVDHGGYAQLQNTGVGTGTTWQWLPSGYQGDQNGGSQIVAGFRSVAYLLNSVSFNNSSTKRIYRAEAEASVYCDGGPITAGLALVFTTTSPASQVASTAVWDGQNSSYIPGIDTTALIRTSINVTAVKSNVPTGLVYCASYLLYFYINDTPNIWTYPSGGGNGFRNLVVQDIGALT